MRCLIWQSSVAAIAPSISVPIFEGGRLRANLKASKARYEQAVAAYVNQVLIAYGDVEDALTDLHAFSDEVESLRGAVNAAVENLKRNGKLKAIYAKWGILDKHQTRIGIL